MTMPKPVLQYRVAYADTDQMGVVYYGNYLALFERARTEWIRQRGFTYKQLEELGIALPVIEAHLNYHAPARYDDVLDLYAELTQLKGVRITLKCQVKRQDVLLVDGYTTLAFVDMASRKPTKPPQQLLQALSEHEGYQANV